LAPLNSTPVDLSPVQASFQEDTGTITLHWSMPAGQDNDHFLVERSRDGYQFETIATVKGGGNYFMTSHFGFTDSQPLDGTSHYRITSVGLRGTGIRLSEPITIDGPAPAFRHLKVYPNPANMEFNLVVTVEKADRGEIQLFNYSGQRVLIKAIYLQEGFNKFPISVGHLSPGTYLVRLVNAKKLLATKPLQIVR
ncbi:MAG: T9SS type A sorting domain-containing protein, partial [Bacteroidota bacterium]